MDTLGNISADIIQISGIGKINQMVWVPYHEIGKLWTVDYQYKRLRQISLDDNYSTIIQTINYDHFASSCYAIAHNGKDLWLGNDALSNAKLYRIDDGITEFNWLSVNPASGSVALGTPQDIGIYLNSRNLFAGEYQANVKINSNDIENPQTIIPVNLQVGGTCALIVNSDSLDFGEIYADFSTTKNLEIANNGSDSLIVSMISCANPIFTTNVTTLALPPWCSENITITFQPDIAGNYNEILEIESNDPLQPIYEIILHGSAIGEPDIAIDTSSIQADLTIPAEMDKTITISNNGNSDLDFSLQFNNNSRSIKEKSQTKIGFYANESRNSINNQLPSWLVKETLRFTGDMIDSYENLPIWNAGMIWMDNALYIVDFNKENEIEQTTGLLVKYDIQTETITNEYPIHNKPYGIAFDGTYLWIGNQSGNIYGYDISTLNDTSNPPVGSFSSPVDYFPAMCFDGSYFLIKRAFNDPGYHPFYRIDYNGTIIEQFNHNLGTDISQLACVQEYGDRAFWAFQNVIEDDVITGGNIIELNIQNQYITSTGTTEFFDNNVIYSFTHDGRDIWVSDIDGPLSQLDDGIWYSINTFSGTIAPDSSYVCTLNLNSNGMYGGNYETELTIHSNDPQETEVAIPIMLNTTGQPVFSFGSSNLDFGEVAVNSHSDLELVINNDGTDVLSINSILSDLPEFTFNETTLEIQPGESENVLVSFNPIDNLDYSALITIDSNAGSYQIEASGIGFLPASISVPSETIETTLNFGETDLKTFTISNVGERTLTYMINVVENGQKKYKDISAKSLEWLIVTPLSDSILPGDNQQVNLTFNGEFVYDGTYQADIVIICNDPLHPQEIVPVALTVNGLPCLELSESSVDLGNQLIGSTGSKNYVVSNSGSALLEVSSITIDQNVFSVEPTSISIQPGESGSLEFYFTPEMQGTIYGNAEFVSNDSLKTIELIGYGMLAKPEIALVDTTVDFGIINIGEEKNLEFTILNQGSETLSISNITSDHTDFTITPAHFTVQPSGMKTVTITCEPSSEDSLFANCTITSNDFDDPEIQFIAIATGKTIPELIVNPETVDLFIIENILSYEQVMLTNTGDADLTFEVGAAINGISWLECYPLSGIIPSGGELELNLTIDTRTLDYDVFIEKLYLFTNDPNNEEYTIPITLNHTDANYTNNDNAGDGFIETPDGDLGIPMDENDMKAPIEFFIYTNETDIDYSLLRIRAFDIDPDEISNVYVNDFFVGYLYGNSDEYSISSFQIDPSIVELGVNAENRIQIDLDVNHYDTGTSTIDWGQFIFNQPTEYASVDYITLSDTEFYPTASMNITSHLSTILYSQDLQINTDLVSYDKQVILHEEHICNLRGNTPYSFSEAFELPSDIANGDYQVHIELIDITTNQVQDIHEEEFYVSDFVPIISAIDNLDFGIVFTGYSGIRNLQIENIGYAPLIIDSVASSSEMFLVDSQEINLMNSEFESIPVQFNPTSNGNYIETITIYSNDPIYPEYEVTLSGIANHPAEVSFSDTFFEIDLPQFSTALEMLEITNTGLGTLEITDIQAIDAPWISVENEEVTLTADSSVSIQIDIDTFDMDEGIYENDLQIISNDPENSYSFVHMVITVTERSVLANFEASPLTGHTPLSVTFTNLSETDDSLAILQFEWDFDNDGLIDSYSENPEFIYQESGIYSVSLTAFTNAKESHTILRENYIEVINNSPILITPLPDVTIPEDSVYTNLDLNTIFDDPDNDELIFSYSNNSNISVEIINGIVTLQPAENWSGIENIIFEADDNLGGVCSDTMNVIITPVNDPPQFIDLPSELIFIRGTELTINFANYVNDPESDLSLLTLTVTNSAHIFSQVTGLEVLFFQDPAYPNWFGSEVIEIHVNDHTGRTISTAEIVMEIQDNFTAQFIANPTAVLAGQTVQFTDLTEGNPNHWIWYLDGDDIPDSNEQNPTTTYNIGGLYPISLVVQYVEEGSVVASDSVCYEDYIDVEGTEIPGGSYFGTWTLAGSPYNVYGEVQIDPDSLLVVEEDVVVNFMVDSTFVINGTLNADEVMFRPYDIPNWQGFSFTTVSDSSKIQGCTIYDAINGISIQDVSIEISNTIIESQEILNNTAPAINIVGSAEPLLHDLDIIDYDHGLTLTNNTREVSQPILTNIRVRRTSDSSKPSNSIGINSIGSVALIADSLEIENFDKGFVSQSNSLINPVIQNSKIFRTLNEQFSEGITGFEMTGAINVSITNLEIEDFGIGFDIDNHSGQLTTPVLTNIRVRRTTDSSRPTDLKGLKINGLINPILNDCIIDNYQYGLEMENDLSESQINIHDMIIKTAQSTSGIMGISLLGSIHSVLDSVYVDNYQTGIKLHNPNVLDSQPVLTNIRVRRTTDSSRPIDEHALTLLGNINPTMYDIELQDYSYGMKIENLLDESLLDLHNVNISVADSSSVSGEIGFKILGNINGLIDSLFIDNYTDGLEINNNSIYESTPVLTNIRVRRTTDSSRDNDTHGLTIDGLVSATLRNILVNDYQRGININSEISELNMKNITIAPADSTSEFESESGLSLVGNIGGIIDSLNVHNSINGVKLENITGNSSTPVLTNIRVRRTSDSTRQDSTIAFLTDGLIDFTLENAEFSNYHYGFDLHNSIGLSSPVLRNISINRDDPSSDNQGIVGCHIEGIIDLDMSDMNVYDFQKGLEIINETNSLSTPVLTNIRVRRTTDSSRPIDYVGCQIYGFIRAKIENSDFDNFSTGIDINNPMDILSTPVLTNIRVRRTTDSSRNDGNGIVLGSNLRTTITESEIIGFNTGIVANDNVITIEENRIENCSVAISLNSLNDLSKIHYNELFLHDDFAFSNCAFHFNNIDTLKVFNNTVDNYDQIALLDTSLVHMYQNVFWNTIPIFEPYVTNSSTIYFTYNNINLDASVTVPGSDNFNLDPLFVDRINQNFELTVFSPCIDAGDPLAPYDPDFSIADIGANYYHHLADFNSDINFVTVNTEVTFESLSEGHGYPETIYNWNFGDDSYDNNENPTHLYQEAGIYSVTLSVSTGPLNDTLTRENFIVVNPDILPAPQNPIIQIVGDGIQLSWDAVTEYENGTPVEITKYLIYSCSEPYGLYQYIGETSGETNWYHQDILLSQEKLFYFLIGFTGNKKQYEQFIRYHERMYINGNTPANNVFEEPNDNIRE